MVAFMATVSAQPFSYIYIQGDKQTPFYVKMEGKMQPRYGKNYSILSELNPGPVHIEILFQQRIFPSQKFTIEVPENGYRGFLLNRQGDSFALYDLQKKEYLATPGEK
ncbi:MAG: hypothetical protein JWQ38_3026 [Flavipsychrobacter sp.]|nr:hypothetical protein [Flavipsychrobacter sp.]